MLGIQRQFLIKFKVLDRCFSFVTVYENPDKFYLIFFDYEMNDDRKGNQEIQTIEHRKMNEKKFDTDFALLLLFFVFFLIK